MDIVNEDWKDYWVFDEAKEGKWMFPTGKRFLISKNTPVLVDKDLGQKNLLFDLFYSKSQGSKIEKMSKGGNQELTLIEDNFTLTPLSPTKDDPDFLNCWSNTKFKKGYFDYSKYTGGDYVFIDNQIQGGANEKDLEKFVFHPDNPSIKKLLAKNHLQVQNRREEFEFEVFYLERDIEKYDPNTRTYYFNNGAKVKTSSPRP